MCPVHGQKMIYKFTRSHHFSADLPQGGLEVSCVFTFTGDLKDGTKITKLLSDPHKTTAKEAEKENEPPHKKKKKLRSLMSTTWIFGTLHVVI